MNCVYCEQGSTHPGRTTITLQRGETTVILKCVAAEICESCGEYFLTEEVTEQILARAEAAVRDCAETSHWDDYALSEPWGATKAAEPQVDLESERSWYAIERSLSDKVTRIANERGVSPETLVNLWIQENISKL